MNKKLIIFYILLCWNLLAYDIKIPTFIETEFEESKVKPDKTIFDSKFIKFKGESTLNYTIKNKDCGMIWVTFPLEKKEIKTIDRLLSYYQIHYKLYHHDGRNNRRKRNDLVIYIPNEDRRLAWALLKSAAKADLMPLIEWKPINKQ